MEAVSYMTDQPDWICIIAIRDDNSKYNLKGLYANVMPMCQFAERCQFAKTPVMAHIQKSGKIDEVIRMLIACTQAEFVEPHIRSHS